MANKQFNAVDGYTVGGATVIAVIDANGNVTANTLSATGNANVANLGTGGLVTATGNIQGGNLVTTGVVSATGNGTFGNVTATLHVGNLSGTGNSNVGNLGATGVYSTILSATGNANVANLGTTGLITATGNITGGNLTTAGILSVTGNVSFSGANVTLGSNSNVKITGGSSGQVLQTDGTGNLSWTSSSGTSATIANGTSNVNIPASGGNVNTSVGGNANVFIVTGTGANVGNIGVATQITRNSRNVPTYVAQSSTAPASPLIGDLWYDTTTGTTFEYTNDGTSSYWVDTSGLAGAVVANLPYLTVNGNISSGHLLPTANITYDLGSATLRWRDLYLSNNTIFLGSQQISGNATTVLMTNLTVSGTITGTFNGAATTAGAVTTNAQPNITSTGTLTSVSVSGNANVGNLNTGGLITATGNIQGGNINTAGIMSSTGNAIHGNISTGGLITATGNIQGGNLNTGGVLSVTGTAQSSIAGNLTLNTKNIISLADPVNAQDAATKNYVDNVAQGLDVKASVRLATAAALAAYTYNNGTAGVGATITASAVGALSIDGVAVATNDRVLIKNETSTNTPYNGIYTVTNTGSGSAAFVLTRALDFNQPTEIPGAFTFVEEGSTLADTGWVSTTNAPVTIGTTNITFSQFSGAGSYTAGTGLTLTGTVFSANASQTQVTAVGTLTTLSVSGNSNIGNVGTTGVFSTTLSSTGNANVGNLGTAGLVTATGNIQSSAFLVGANLSITGNANVGNIGATLHVGNLSGTGNSNVGNLAATGQLISTVATGTAPLVVSSTTTVANLTAATATTAGTVTTNAQPNITSVGTLTGLTSSGAISITNSTAATSTTTGALIITGGIGTSANSYITNVTVKSNISYVAPNGSNTINSQMLNGGTLAWSGNAGQLFSIADTMTGNIFSVNDVSGIPMITVDAGGNISFAPSGGFVAYGVSNGITSAGTTQGTATVLTRPINVVSTVGASSGVILPATVPGMRIIVMNTSATALNVYPASGGQINALGTNAAFSLAAGARLEYVATTTTQWYTLNATYA